MTLAHPVRLAALAAALGCATAGPRTASDRTDDYQGYGAKPRPPGDAREPSPAPLRFAASLLGGGGESFDVTYHFVGARLGYRLGPGFEATLDCQAWNGAGPNILRLAPGVSWVAPVPLSPTLGVYYVHGFVSSTWRADEDGGGLRVGARLFGDDPVALSVGGAYEYGDSGPAWWLEGALVFRF